MQCGTNEYRYGINFFIDGDRLKRVVCMAVKREAMRAFKYSSHIMCRSCHTSPSTSIVKNDKLKAFGIGNIAGTLGSFCGMGGSFIAIPLMTQMLKITQVDFF